MPFRTLITQDDGANTVSGGPGAELIYGFDPNGPQSQITSIGAERIASGLLLPLFATAAPDDSTRLFVLEQTGQIKIVDLASNTTRSTPFLDLSSETVATGEQGLLGLAFHPDYATNHQFYVYVSTPSGDVEIRRYQTSADPNVANPATEQTVLSIDFPSGFTNHRAGWMSFGPDRALYVSVGEGNVSANSQTLANPLGKILRLDVDHDAFPGDPTRNYALPSDNPAVIDGLGAAAGTGIYAAGLRNPWRDTFDRGLGDFYIADVGGSQWEEFNQGIAGKNYGWPTTEGAFDPVTFPDFTNPIFFYPHGTGPGEGFAITGGYIYRGSSDAAQGQYFFADFVNDTISTLQKDGATWAVTDRTAQIVPDVGLIDSPSSFGEDALGNLYVVDYGTGGRTGEVFRLTPQTISNDQGDRLDGGGGDDLIFAGAGDDVVMGGSGNDEIQGGVGNDVLQGGGGSDYLIGGVGNDWYLTDQDDLIVEKIGEGSQDRVFARGSFTLTDGAEIEIFSTDSHAGTAAVTLIGNELANLIYGNNGADIIDGKGGADTLVGLDGDDWFYVDNASDVIVEVSGGGADRVFAAVSYVLSAGREIEKLTTTNNFAITAINLTGNELINAIYGNAGNNILNGAGGNDVLVGLGGNDTFLFNTALNAVTNVDRISDFGAITDDLIALSQTVFSAAGAVGTLAASAFNSGPGMTAASDASDRIVYNTTNGALYYDPDGVAGVASTQFAILVNRPGGLDAADFVIV